MKTLIFLGLLIIGNISFGDTDKLCTSSSHCSGNLYCDKPYDAAFGYCQPMGESGDSCGIYDPICGVGLSCLYDSSDTMTGYCEDSDIVTCDEDPNCSWTRL